MEKGNVPAGIKSGAPSGGNSRTRRLFAWPLEQRYRMQKIWMVGRPIFASNIMSCKTDVGAGLIILDGAKAAYPPGT
jgi:hypothetical protein